MKKLTQSEYQKIKQCNFYKKHLGHYLHLCTIYGVAGDKTFPLWKRLLSHVYIILIFQVVEEDNSFDTIITLTEEQKESLINQYENKNVIY